MNKDELIEYALSKYGAKPEYLWKRAPNYFVFLHATGGKWFAVVMDVPKKGSDWTEAKLYTY